MATEIKKEESKLSAAFICGNHNTFARLPTYRSVAKKGKSTFKKRTRTIYWRLTNKGWIRRTGERFTRRICCAFLLTSSSEEVLSILMTVDLSKLYLSLSNGDLLTNGRVICILLLTGASSETSLSFRFLSLSPSCGLATSVCTLELCLVWAIPLQYGWECTRNRPFKISKALQASFSFKILPFTPFKTIPFNEEVSFIKDW